MGLLLKKNHILRSWDCLSLLNWIGVLALSQWQKNAPKKTGIFIWSRKSLFSEIVLYLYKSNIQLCMEYCCQVWAGTPSCYLNILGKLHKQVCKTVDSSIASFLEPLSLCQNVASQAIYSIGINLVDVHLNWLKWFHFFILIRNLPIILVGCMFFL